MLCNISQIFSRIIGISLKLNEESYFVVISNCIWLIKFVKNHSKFVNFKSITKSSHFRNCICACPALSATSKQYNFKEARSKIHSVWSLSIFSDFTMASAQDEVLAIRKKLEKITEQGSDDSQAMDLLKNLSDIEMWVDNYSSLDGYFSWLILFI